VTGRGGRGAAGDCRRLGRPRELWARRGRARLWEIAAVTPGTLQVIPDECLFVLLAVVFDRVCTAVSCVGAFFWPRRVHGVTRTLAHTRVA